MTEERIDNQTVMVYNDNIYPLTENFKGDRIHIEPNQFVEMDFYDAHEFKGQYKPIQVDGAGNKKPESFKKVRIVMPKDFNIQKAMNISPDSSLKCNACGKVFKNVVELNKHVSDFHSSQKFDEEKDRTLKKC